MQNTEEVPSGSTDLASIRASDVARSTLAGVTARIRQVSFDMNCKIISRIWASISTGWSPTGIFVKPGRSISVMFKTAATTQSDKLKKIHSLPKEEGIIGRESNTGEETFSWYSNEWYDSNAIYSFMLEIRLFLSFISKWANLLDMAGFYLS